MKKIIGRCEWFSIPEFGVDWVRAKVDTGSKSSALHACDIEPFKKGRENWLRFQTIDGREAEAAVIFRKGSERYFIEITVEAVDQQKMDLLVELSDRGQKKFPLSLGRRELSPFLVDGEERFLLGKV